MIAELLHQPRFATPDNIGLALLCNPVAFVSPLVSVCYSARPIPRDLRLYTNRNSLSWLLQGF